MNCLAVVGAAKLVGDQVDPEASESLRRSGGLRECHDHLIPTPESCIARIYDIASQGTVSRLSAHTSMPKPPREPPRDTRRPLDAIPGQLCCSPT